MKTLKKYTPMRTITNLSRTADKYGSVTFISFLGAVLSRLAYMNDNQFFDKYMQIMGPVITPPIMEGIAGVPHDNLQDLLDDEKMFNLKSEGSKFKTYEYNGKKYIDLIAEQMPQNINAINEESVGHSPIEKINKFASWVSKKKGGDPSGNEVDTQKGSLNHGDVEYISIGWSNYGEIFVVADKRMNSIFVIFRGTYSAKTASLYANYTSLVPLSVCEDPDSIEKFLYGMFKPTAEMIHTITESVRYLATKVLNATAANPVKIFTIGHSLGGGMCTIFSYLWMKVKQTAPYNAAPYDVISNNIVCLSLGAPRCMNKAVANKFCEYVKSGQILYKRITTRGDPVTWMPPSQFGFAHPCSNDEEDRKQVSVECNNTIKVRPPVPSYIDYDKNLDCQNYKTRMFADDLWAHTNYLDIMYTHAIDINNFNVVGKMMTGNLKSTEVARQNDSTVCRIVIGTLTPVNEGGTLFFFNIGSSTSQPADTPQREIELPEPQKSTTPSFKVQCKAVFFNVDKARINPQYNSDEQSEDKGEIELTEFSNNKQPEQEGGRSLRKFKLSKPVEEDCKMTQTVFDTLIGKFKDQPFLQEGKYTPLTSTVSNLFNNIFTEPAEPNISCQPLSSQSTTPNVVSTGGKKTKRRHRKPKKTTRKHQRRTKKTKTRRRRVRI